MTLPFELSVDIASRRIVLRSVHLSMDSSWQPLQDFLGRLLSSPVVESVDLDRRHATAVVTLNDGAAVGAVGAAALIRSIAAALRTPAEPRRLPADVYAQSPQFILQTTPTGVTAGIITSQTLGRVRIRHPLLQRNPEVVRRVESGLAKIAGVQSVTGSSLTGSVLILFLTGSNSPQQLLADVERHIDQSDEGIASLADPPVSHWVAAATCLGLAGATIVQPALAPATAAALVVCNLPTLSRGIVELCTCRWKVSSLYTVIMGTTLASGQFLAAAIMQASVTGWHTWTNHRLRKVVHELSALSESGGSLLVDKRPELAGSGTITPGLLVTVPQGAVLPFDGIVVSGEADLDEHGVRGLQVPVSHGSGDPVFAGSVVLRGGLQVRVTAVASQTRLSAIRRSIHSLICEAVGNGAATPRGKALASRFVPYTFATGTAALLVGDLTTLAAVLRPDFCTGPSMTDRLGTLSSVSHLLHEGWLVRNCETLNALSRVQTVVVAETSAATESAHAVRIQRLKGAPRPIELQSFSGSVENCVEHVRSLSRNHQDVAVVGSQCLLSELADADVVRISLTPELSLGQSHADLIALHAESQRIGDLLHLLEETRRPARNGWTAILACNALAISGAFLIGLTSLHVVALTNAGVLAAGVLYERQVRRSKRLLSTHTLHRPQTPEDKFEIIVQEKPAPRAPDLENPALQPVVPRHGPGATSRESNQRFQPDASYRGSRLPKSERPVPKSN